MTAYTVAVGEVGAYEKALTAATEDTVTFGGGPGDTTIVDLSYVEILHHTGTKPIYARFGGTATVKGALCRICPPGMSTIIEPGSSGDTVVHLISEADAVYSVANGS